MTWRARLLEWAEPEDNPRSAVYGTIAAGLVIAAEDPVINSYASVVTATAVAVATYWLAHGYAQWVAQRLQSRAVPGVRWSPRGLVDALVHEWPLAEGAAIPFGSLLVLWVVGVPLTAGVTAAVWIAAVALLVFEAAGALRRKLPLSHVAAHASVGLLLGSALFAVKGLLH